MLFFATMQFAVISFFNRTVSFNQFSVKAKIGISFVYSRLYTIAQFSTDSSSITHFLFVSLYSEKLN